MLKLLKGIRNWLLTNTIFEKLAVLTASFFPFMQFTPHVRIFSILTILLVLVWLLEGSWKKIKIFSSLLWVLPALFLFYVLGYLPVWDSGDAGFDLQVKLTLLLFPLMFSARPLSKNRFSVILALNVGSLLSIIWMLIAAAVGSGSGIERFIYTSLSASLNMHPSYLSLYFTLVLFANIFYYRFAKEQSQKKLDFLLAISMGMMILGIAFLQSKGAILALGLAFVYTLFRYRDLWLYWPKYWIGLICIVGGLFALGEAELTGKRFKSLYKDFDNGISENPKHSTETRLAAWSCSLEKIGESPLFGFGTGQVTRVLSECYTERGYDYLKQYQINAHNQYFQTSLALGVIPGFLLFMAWLWSGIVAWKKKDELCVIFIILTGIHMLFESMLEAQAGVLFFAFIWAWLWSSPRNTPSPDQQAAPHKSKIKG